MKNIPLLKRFLPYFKPYGGWFALDLLCAATTTLCDVALPLIVGYITDTATSDTASLTPRAVLLCAGLYLALRIVDGVGSYYMCCVGHYMGARIETDMRADLFGHIQSLSCAYFTQTKVGQLMSRITNDLFEVTEFAHHCPEVFFIAILKALAAFIMVAAMNLPLALIIFACLPLMVLFASRYNHKMRRTWRESRTQVGEINAQVEDSLQGVRVVKSFTNEDYEQARFQEGNQLFLRMKKQIYTAMGGLTVTTRAFDGLMYLIVLLLGSFMLIKGRLSGGDLVAVLLYVSMLLTTIRSVVEYTEQFQRGVTGIERFVEVMDVEPEIIDPPEAVELSQVRGEIVFNEVGFSYPDQPEVPVLSHINIHIHPGDNVALVGPSGAGKTTLCNLLPRFYELTAGSISVDGIDIRQIAIHSLRQHIGMVQQDVYLFAGTVAENIRYGQPGATPEQVRQAARRANADEFIQALPEGYDTYIGERGVRLSGGQKQRLSIARAFLKDPPILILDEATSALDNESERIVQRSLEQLSQGRTTFTIAHRLTTIRRADLILVLTEQGLVEAGTHQQLLARKGVYYDLYNA